MVKRYSRLEQDDQFELMDKIENILLEGVYSPVKTEEKPFSDKILNENERCSLYYMLSYHVNLTEKMDYRTSGISYSSSSYGSLSSSSSSSSGGISSINRPMGVQR